MAKKLSFAEAQRELEAERRRAAAPAAPVVPVAPAATAAMAAPRTIVGATPNTWVEREPVVEVPEPEPALQAPEAAGAPPLSIGDILLKTGMGIGDTLQAAIAGRLAAQQGRGLDYQNETTAGRDETRQASAAQAQAQKAATDRQQQIQMYLAAIADQAEKQRMADQQLFTANEAALNRELTERLTREALAKGQQPQQVLTYR